MVVLASCLGASPGCADILVFSPDFFSFELDGHQINITEQKGVCRECTLKRALALYAEYRDKFILFNGHGLEIKWSYYTECWKVHHWRIEQMGEILLIFGVLCPEGSFGVHLKNGGGAYHMLSEDGKELLFKDRMMAEGFAEFLRPFGDFEVRQAKSDALIN